MKRLWSQELYLQAYRFAAEAHREQKVPGTDISYLMHLSIVAMETMSALCHDEPKSHPDLAVQCAILHDVIEDTDVTYDDVFKHFGQAVADGVMALTKDTNLPTKRAQMEDSLQRIVQQPHEVWLVKLADRTCNLAPPPYYWQPEKRRYYQEEARLILNTLRDASPSLTVRLSHRIEAYSEYITLPS